jgi:hypothetical protein
MLSIGKPAPHIATAAQEALQCAERRITVLEGEVTNLKQKRINDIMRNGDLFIALSSAELAIKAALEALETQRHFQAEMILKGAVMDIVVAQEKELALAEADEAPARPQSTRLSNHA